MACGDRLKETLTLIKSALMFSKGHLNFIVIAEDTLKDSLNEKVRSKSLRNCNTISK